MADFSGHLDELRGLLRHALTLELSTIPPYATACFSIKEEGQYDRSSPQIVNAEPIEVIRQVMVEEMLHMALAANVLNAVGGAPALDDPEWVPTYPRRLLPNGKGPQVRLRRFTPEQIKAFREVERAPPSIHPLKTEDCAEADTIGAFYACIIVRLNRLCADAGEKRVFCGDPARQLRPQDYYGAGGGVIVVKDLKTANTALAKIIDEGEGADVGHRAGDGDWIPGEDREDVAHFFKFNEIYCSRYYQPDDRLGEPPTGGDLAVDWSAVWPMKDDPKAADFADAPQVLAKVQAFNALYSDFLRTLNQAFNGSPGLLAESVPTMYRLKYAAQELMRIPINGKGETAGPTWEYVSAAR